MVIHKYPLKLDRYVELYLPVRARLLHVDLQHGQVCVWAEVDPFEHARETRRFAIYCTGEDLPPNPGRYFGTVMLNDGELVLHIYVDEVDSL